MNEYKIFKITYNDGGWHSGPLPTAFFIAKNEEEVIEKSEAYKKFEKKPGDIWISEFCDTSIYKNIENMEDFNIEINPKELKNNYE